MSLIDNLSDDDLERINSLLTPRIVDEYYVHVPHPAQQLALALNHEEMLWGGAAGGGKLLWISCEVLSINKGWTTIGELEVGDDIYDHEGNPTKVLAKSDIEYNGTYLITMDDGEKIFAHKDHLWNVSTQRQRDNYSRTDPSHKAKRRTNRKSRSITTKAGGEGSGKGGTIAAAQATALKNSMDAAERRDSYVRPSIWDYTTTMTTVEIKALMDAESRAVSIPVGSALQGTAEWKSAIPPYTFGAWLGDGDSNDGTIYVCADDYLDFTDELVKDGWNTTVTWFTKGRKQPFGKITLKNKNGATLRSILKDEGFLKNKNIPDWIIATSFADKQAFLGGILDTDGHVDSRGRIQFAMAREHLVNKTHEIFWSMGIAPTEVKYKKTLNQIEGFSGNSWRFDVSQCPSYLFRLPRKRDLLDSYNPSSQRKYKEQRYIQSIVKVDDIPMQCIQVDNDRGLFRVGRTFLTTHNSDFLLMAALQYCDIPGYSALILRRTWPDLNSPNSILDRFTSWMAGKNVHKREQGRIWEFPSGAKIQFGYASSDTDKYKFQGAEYQFVGFDEATQFEWSVYDYLKSRLRRPTIPCAICTLPLTRYFVDNNVRYRHTNNNVACDYPLPDPVSLEQYKPSEKDGMTIFEIPLRMRCTANPGGLSHIEFKEHFIDEETRDPKSIFIPATMDQNPYLDKESYKQQLEGMRPVDRERLLNGDWEVLEAGNLFERGNFVFVDSPPEPKDVKSRVRFWDLAASDGKNSDWTVGALCSVTHDGRWFIEDIIRVQYLPPDVEKLMRKTAEEDGLNVKIYSEQEPGSSGKAMVSHIKRHVLPGYQYDGERSTGSKTARANALVGQVGERNVYVVKNTKWNKILLDEADLFPNGAHDDQIDAIAGSFNKQTVKNKRARLVASW